MDPTARRAAVRRFVLAVLVMVAGAVFALLTSGTASIIGWGVVGVGLTLLISFVFLEVGLSEDRARDAGTH